MIDSHTYYKLRYLHTHLHISSHTRSLAAHLLTNLLAHSSAYLLPTTYLPTAPTYIFHRMMPIKYCSTVHSHLGIWPSNQQVFRVKGRFQPRRASLRVPVKPGKGGEEEREGEEGKWLEVQVIFPPLQQPYLPSAELPHTSASPSAAEAESRAAKSRPEEHCRLAPN